MKKIFSVFSIYLLFFPFITNAGPLDIRATADKITDFQFYEGRYGEELIKYQYITNALSESRQNEIMSKRTPNSQTFQLSEKKYQTKYYLGTQFFKKNNDWFQVETATTTLKQWNSQYKPSIINKIFGLPAKAENFFVGEGDGNVSNNEGDWTPTRSDTTGGYSGKTDPSNWVGCFPTTSKDISRAFFPVLVSDIPAGSTINTATFNVYGVNHIGSATFGLILTTQASPTDLVVGDFDNLTLNSPDEGADREAMLDQSYTEFSFNSTGKSWIPVGSDEYVLLGLRSGVDIDDTGYTGCASFEVYFSETTGTATDPYLLVTWEAGEEPPVEINIATTTDMNIENISYIATTTTLNASTTLTVGEYKIPFILYLLVLSAFCFTLLAVFTFNTLTLKK